MELEPEDFIRIKSIEEEIHYKLDMDVGDNMYDALVAVAQRNLSEEEKQHLLFKAGFKLMIENAITHETANGQIEFDFDHETLI
mgnify:FL=1